jgi:hypothetical protein
MAYMNYNRELYRTGFRPYGQTNPWAASQLNGMDIPEAVLSGYLGQSRPFTRDGGWGLHGSASFHPWVLEGLGQSSAGAPTGSYLLYQGTWQLSPSHESSAQILASVLQILKSSASVIGFQVGSASQSGGLFTVSNFNVQIQLFVSGPGFAEPNDAGSVVDHAYNQVTGLMPVVSNTVVTQLPTGTTAAPAPTGTSPFPGSADPNCVAGMPYMVSGAPCPSPGAQDFTTWLGNNAWWLALVAAGAIVLPRVL